jgi:hypothetical protein
MGIVYINHLRTTELRTKRDKLWVCGVQRGVCMQVDKDDKDVC